jgi:hypothetical protein
MRRLQQLPTLLQFALKTRRKITDRTVLMIENWCRFQVRRLGSRSGRLVGVFV